MTNGLIIAAPSSGAGKTMVTLGLLRAFKNRGVDVSSAKSGPDYIDPAFHRAACGKECVNLDAWAMDGAQTRGLAHHQGGELLLIEGAMGLFDGALDADDPLGKGSVGDLAAMLDLPVVLVLDAGKQGQSAAAIITGLAGFRADVRVNGVILNNVGSARHEQMLRRAIGTTRVPVLGAVPRHQDLTRGSRHLGLVQATEDPKLEEFITNAATIVSHHVDLAALAQLAAPVMAASLANPMPAFGQKIAVARDAAFAFCYPHLLQGWRDAGAEIHFFSPLADQPPAIDADMVYLPGGYPELFAEQLAGNQGFLQGLVQSDAQIYGECGGYMVLGESLQDANGVSHKMAGLLPVSTSFKTRKRHLGYRILCGLAGVFAGRSFMAHEFHYASITSAAATGHLFAAQDSMGQELAAMGHVRGKVSGSFAHIICPAGFRA